MRQFKAVEHRLQHVGTVSGVEYFNDSKATNVDATIKAIESFPGKIHLILGGKDKDSDYTLMNQLLRERVTRVYTIGAAAEKIRSHEQSKCCLAANAGSRVERAMTWPKPERLCCWPRPVPASISLRTTNIAGAFLLWWSVWLLRLPLDRRSADGQARQR